MKRILLVPTHPGVNSMLWAWMLSQSPDLYGPRLPAHQFIGITTGSYGSYPDIEEDFFSTSLCSTSNPDTGEDSDGDPDLAVSDRYFLGGMLQDFENRNAKIWEDENELKIVFNEFITALNDAEDIPGVVIVVPSWMHSSIAMQIAEDYKNDELSIQTVLVKSNLRKDKQQRLFFLYNAGGGEEEDIDSKLLDLVNAEIKQDAKSWSCKVNAGDSTDVAIATQAFTDLGLRIPDNIKELVARAKQHIDSITPVESDPFEGGIENFDWDTWLDTKDPAVLFDQNLSLHMLYEGEENLPPIHKTPAEIEAKLNNDVSVVDLESWTDNPPNKFPSAEEPSSNPNRVAWPKPSVTDDDTK